MSPPPLPPRELTVLGGRYRVLKPLGSGGSAEVYLAEQLSLKRKVALKVITRRGPVQPDAHARFKREALIHSSIDHPSVVRILDFETDGPEGTVVILEYVEGVRLDEAIMGRRMDPLRAGRLLLQLAEGLAAIHARGVVHRDFKAENVMLSEGATGTQARILDFGLARLFDADLLEGDGRSFVSNVGMTAATPAYAAPEQLRGLPADPRTDVYGFGITAYFMLTGHLPFNGPELHDFLEQHTNQEPPSLKGKVPDELAALVESCLQKDPAKRPAGGQALVSILTPVTPVEMEDILPATMVSKAVPAFPVAIEPTPRPKKKGGSSMGVVLVLFSLLMGSAAFFAVEQPWLPKTQARWLLRANQPALALERLGAEDSSTASVRALALEALGKQDELAKLIKERCIAVASGLDAADRQRLKVSFASCH
ncbi:MAG: serine/threonine-protein kinase [Archangium sp.]|nr:serine/threonine-protein kinase [Archangium sp.]MDP3153444.1 serine/threonine-protein kinase [Archangium sp.]MDP3574680.1 serine/threonine-protein kinase [Archangium sp.]